jgi:hypothetical protein
VRNVSGLNLVIRFACELAALVGVAWFGWQTSPVLAVIFPLLVAGVWGIGIAPRAELTVFAAATAAFVAVGQAAAAAVFAVLAVASAVLVRVWPETVA